MLAFRTKVSDRWSDRLTPAGILDMALRGNEVQGRLLFLPAVAVGGTAAALYARHRVSLDVDFVSPYLREQFALNVIESQ